MKWISVKKQLPPLHKEVLLTDGEYVKVGQYSNDNTCSYPVYCTCCYDLGKITYWAELSDLPKEKDAI